MSIREEFGRVGFTPEEKTDLTAHLIRAAEQEENMTASTKRKIKKISGGMVFGIAAACLMSVGALAAVLSPGLKGYFDTPNPGAQEVLEDGIYRLDRSETLHGWTVALAECVGDDNKLCIWADITAPRGKALISDDERQIDVPLALSGPEGDLGIGVVTKTIPDEDPEDNRLSLCFEVYHSQPLRGRTLDVKIGPITDTWFSDESLSFEHGSELTQAVRDHVWTFRDVALDYPDQTVRLTPNVEIPYLDGTATLTSLELSPLGMTVRAEGGACARLVELEESGLSPHGNETTVESGNTIVSFGVITAGQDMWERREKLDEYANALEVCVQMKDGSVQSTRHRGYSFDRGPAEEGGIPYLERQLYYPSEQPGLDQVIDPAQADRVTVCGVDIPIPAPESKPEPPAEEPVSIWQQIFRNYWK